MEAEEEAFAPGEPKPRCKACKGTGESVIAPDEAEPECPECHGKGHLFRFEVYQVDIEADAAVDCDWADLADVARSIGMPEAQLRAAAISPHPMARAWVYEAIGNHYGWHNLDDYPLLLTEWELERRWAE